MQLTWSHAVIYVHDEAIMLDFTPVYSALKLPIRPLADNAPDIIFLSQCATEHHQLAMVPVRQNTDASNSVNHFAFRVGEFTDLAFARRLGDMDGIQINPISHGNTLSIYFNDPEGNGLEVFWDTHGMWPN